MITPELLEFITYHIPKNGFRANQIYRIQLGNGLAILPHLPPPLPGDTWS